MAAGIWFALYRSAAGVGSTPGAVRAAPSAPQRAAAPRAFRPAPAAAHDVREADRADDRLGDAIRLLRAARKAGDSNAAIARIRSLAEVAADRPRDLAALLRAETVAPGDPPIGEELGTAVRLCAAREPSKWIEALGAESSQLVRPESDPWFDERVNSLYRLVVALARPSQAAMLEFLPTASNRAAGLEASRLGLFTAVGALRPAAFANPLNAVARDGTESLAVRRGAASALLQIDPAAGLACIAAIAAEVKDPGGRLQILLDAAACRDYAAAFAFAKQRVAQDTRLHGRLMASFCVQLAAHNAQDDAAGVAAFLGRAIEEELEKDPNIAATLLQTLSTGGAISPPLRDELARRDETRGLLLRLAEDESRRGEFVALSAAGAWATTTSSAEELFAMIDRWSRSNPAAFRGALMQGSFLRLRISDARERAEFVRRFQELVRPMLAESTATETLTAALAACTAGDLIELVPEVRRIAESDRVAPGPRGQAARVLEHLERKAERR